ncbi:hypothetical protein P7C70_g3886, partial [Phenoliferia sp. Uapishka_3]
MTSSNVRPTGPPRRASLSNSRRLSASRIIPAEAFAASFAQAEATEKHSGLEGLPRLILSQHSSASSSGSAVEADEEMTATAQGTGTPPERERGSSFNSSSSSHSHFNTTSPTSISPIREAPTTLSTAHHREVKGIRARRPSLSSRLPLNQSSTIPTTATTEHDYSISGGVSTTEHSMPGRRKDVGLGLMLDEEQSVGTTAAQQIQQQQQQQPPQQKSHSSFGIGLDIRGAGGAESRRNSSEEHSPNRNNGIRNGTTSRTGTPPPAPPTPRTPNLPPPSTRLSTTGGSPNPLLVYTGTNSTTLPPRAPSPSNISPPGGLSQRTYPQSQSTISPNPFFPSSNSTSRSSTSTPPNRMNLATSYAMDRSGSSGSKSRSGEVHGRQQSLTSACPPVTSSVPSPNPSITAGFLSSVTNGAGGGGAASNGGSPVQRSWKVYDWGGSKEKEKEKESASSSPTSSSRDSIDRKGHRLSGASSLLFSPSTILSLPTTLLSYILAPLNSTTPYHHSPLLSSSSSALLPTPKQSLSTSNNGGVSGPIPTKRYPFPVRLVTMSYLIFATLFLSINVGTWAIEGGFAGSSIAGSNGLDSSSRIAPRDAAGPGLDGVGRKV